MSGRMTPKQAEEWLGMKPSARGLVLLRMALQREEQLGRRFLIRNGKSGRGARYRFTRDIIRTHLRDLWQSRFERFAARTAAAVRRIETHIDQQIDDRIEAHPLVQQLVDQQADTMQQLESLTVQVDRVSEVHRRSPKCMTKVS